MRIAILAAEPVKTHGWGRYARDLIVALAEAGHAITLITSTGAARRTDLPVTDYHLTLPPLTPAPRFSSLHLLRQIVPVRRMVKGCDLIHVVAEPYVLAAPGNYPLIVTAHGTYVPQTARRPVSGLLYRSAYRRAFILCCSSYTERQVKAVLPDARTRVITNGVDFDLYHRPVDPARLPKKAGPTVLAVGQHKSRKGFHILAQAMRRVRAVIPDAQAVFIGDTSDTAYVEAIREQLAADGLTGAVQILGRTPEEILLGWYHAADVFALPGIDTGGRFEGFGLVYLEAGAAGLPVIGTSNSGGAQDAIRDGETGLLVPPNDPDATADAIIKLLRDPELRARMGAAGIAYAGQNTWKQVAQRVTEVYTSLTAEAKA
jgi:phosphatidylinositol alpha-1,6-mannosyltransferase